MSFFDFSSSFKKAENFLNPGYRFDWYLALTVFFVVVDKVLVENALDLIMIEFLDNLVDS